MNDRGLTLIELLVAALIGVIVVLGLGTFYLSTLRFARGSESQAFLQRQGTLIVQEFGRQIRGAGSLQLEDSSFTNCLGGVDLPALVVVNSTGTFCFYRNTAGRLIRCLVAGGPCNANRSDLLSGSPVSLSATSLTFTLLTPCEATAATCSAPPRTCSNPALSCGITPGVTVEFTLVDGTNAPMAFRISLTTSRHI